jgi:signal transduction histidine kinase
MKLREALILFFLAIFMIFIGSHFYAYTEYRKLFLKNVSDRIAGFETDLETYVINNIKDGHHTSIQNILDTMVATRPIISSLSVSIEGQTTDYSSDRALKNKPTPEGFVNPQGMVYEELMDGKFDFIYSFHYFNGAKKTEGKIFIKLNEWRIVGEMNEKAVALMEKSALIQLLGLSLLAFLFYRLGVTPLYKTLKIAENSGGSRESFWVNEVDALHEAMLGSFEALSKKNHQLIEKEEQFRNIFENMSSGAIVYTAVDEGADFVFKEVNSAVEKIEKTEKESLLGKRVTMAFPAVAEFGFLEAFQRVWKSGAPERFPLSFYHDGRVTGWRDNYIYRLSNGDLAVVYDDLTEQKQAEEKIKELNRSLEGRIEEETAKRLLAEQAMFAKTKMVLMGDVMGMVAHHWRQPLNALGITIQDIPYAFKAGEVNEAYIKDTVESSMRHIQKMSKTIDEFRSFFAPNKLNRDFFIEDAITSVLNIVKPSFDEHGITITLNIEQKHMIDSYETEFKQVIINLLSNAKDAVIEHADENKQINITVKDEDNFITISIEDSGGGIPSEVIDRVFDPYFSTKEQGKGAGIGLYMSRQLVEKHMGGTISASNGKMGARLEIKLKNQPKEL